MITRSRNGYYYYKIYDAKTDELLAEGTCQEAAEKMGWDATYPAQLMHWKRHHPNAKSRFERVEREWVETLYEIYDKNTGATYKGNYDDCSNEIIRLVGNELKPETLKKYFINGSRRFRVKRLSNV